jgi:TM2 domain-containing membrane protein YozV
MKGKILDFSIRDNTGIITGDDGSRYTFTGSEWKSERNPVRGMSVDFVNEGSNAKSVYIGFESAGGTYTKNKVTAGVLAICLGFLGIHKFYLGFRKPGLVFLLVNTIGFSVSWLMLCIPNMVLGIIAVVEGIIYLTKTDEEFEELYVVQKKQWF